MEKHAKIVALPARHTIHNWRLQAAVPQLRFLDLMRIFLPMHLRRKSDDAIRRIDIRIVGVGE